MKKLLIALAFAVGMFGMSYASVAVNVEAVTMTGESFAVSAILNQVAETTDFDIEELNSLYASGGLVVVDLEGAGGGVMVTITTPGGGLVEILIEETF